MKSTKGPVKGRKPSWKGYLDAVGSENCEYARAHVDTRMDEDNNIISISFDSNRSLLTRALQKENLNAAYLKVFHNNGAGGVDGMGVGELFTYLHENQETLLKELEEGKYKPNPVRRTEIPKEEPGKFRLLGIPTVVDRVIQQAIAQVLTPIYEYAFSEYSYGFRPGRDCHMALKQVQEYANEGYCYAVDIDLAKYFDTVNHSRLIQIMSETIKDGKVISLLNKYLTAGAWEGGMFKRTEEGVPQGGPISPLLGNIYLNQLDWELERRGHKFVRYADDVLILCKSPRAAERTMESITRFIEGDLRLKVNHEKSKVVHLKDVKYLGYGFYFRKGECRLKIHEASIAKFKRKRLNDVLKRNNMDPYIRVTRWGMIVKGWLNYFKLSDAKSSIKELDGWCRRYIRMIYRKQWKTVKARFRKLKDLGVTGKRLHNLANMRCGPWRAAKVLNRVLTNQVIINWGYISMFEYYEGIH